MVKTKNLCGMALFVLILLLLQCKSFTPLSVKSYEGNLYAVKGLINEGYNVNDYDKWGMTPLIWACYYSNYDIAEVLLENGANPNLRSRLSYGSIPIGSTPLMIAAYNGHAMMVKLLLEHNASKSITDANGCTAAKYAKNGGDQNVINLVRE